MSDQIPNYAGDSGRLREATPIYAPSISPAGSWAAITPSADVITPPLVAVWVNQPCTLTVTGDDDASLTFTISQAGPVPIVPKKITAISTGTVFGLRAKAAA
jgi:hypothetical protein